MKILYLTKFLPYPAYGGGLKRNLAWINFFKKRVEIDVLGFYNEQINNKAYFDNSDNLKISYIKFKKNLAKAGLMSIVHASSLINSQYYSKQMKYKIKELIKNNNYDYVFISEIAMAQYAKFTGNIPILFDDHNVEYELINRTSKFSTFPINIFLKLESKKIMEEETKILTNSYKNFFVSDRDLDFFDSKIKDKSIVVNNSFDDRYDINNEMSSMPTLIFVGNLSWKPNKHGLLHFINNIYLKLYEKNKEIKFNIVGSCLSKEIANFNNKYNISIYENATEQEKDKLINESWITIVPVYFGSGTRIKILEYWSHGKTVLSTSIGAEGLESSKGTFIVDTDDEQINSIEKLLLSKEKLKEFGKYNYKIFKENYCEEVIYENTLYKSIFTK